MGKIYPGLGTKFQKIRTANNFARTIVMTQAQGRTAGLRVKSYPTWVDGSYGRAFPETGMKGRAKTPKRRTSPRAPYVLAVPPPTSATRSCSLFRDAPDPDRSAPNRRSRANTATSRSLLCCRQFRRVVRRQQHRSWIRECSLRNRHQVRMRIYPPPVSPTAASCRTGMRSAYPFHSASPRSSFDPPPARGSCALLRHCRWEFSGL